MLSKIIKYSVKVGKIKNIVNLNVNTIKENPKLGNSLHEYLSGSNLVR